MTMPDNRRPQLSYQITASGDGLRVAIAGEIDMATADRLLGAILDELPGHDDTLTLDLAGVTFCDSAGINAFIRLRNRQTDADHGFHLVNVTAAVRRVLELSGLTAILNIDAAEPQAADRSTKDTPTSA